MPNGDIISPIYQRQNIIADRIGPIFDPAFLRVIPHDKLRDIAVIQLKAHQMAVRAELQAVEQIAKELEGMRF